MRGLTLREAPNVLAVARREFVTRTATRTYLLATLFLVLAAVVVGLVPVAVGYFSRESTRVAVFVGAPDLRADAVATLDALLNPPAAGSQSSTGEDRKAFTVTGAADREAGRRDVLEGRLSAFLDVERAPGGELTFTVFTKETGDGPTVLVSRQAATSIAVADRLGREGITPAAQAALFAAPTVDIRSPDDSKAATSQPTAQQLANIGVVFGLELFLLLALILYGNWVAQSVVEEKSSRMMEIILSAATPFELLAGKVLGVSAAALLQFAAVVGAALLALLAEGQVASLVLGESGGIGLPSGLTPSLLVAFAVLFVLGFVLYAAVFAAAGSLVSRHEDVNQIVMPTTLVACAGYMLAVYSSIGTLDAGSPLVVALSWVPFLSPYMMLTRFSAGDVGLVEVGLAAVLLAATIVLAAWVASRIYAAGVLRYGQKPSLRGMWAALREGQ